MLTAIVTSDNHLGAYSARLRPDRLEERRRRLQANFERVVDAAIDRKVDLFLQAGDLFDRPDPRNAERNFVARQVRRLLDERIPLFAIAGNHDRPRSFGRDDGALPHEEMEALGAIHLFRETRRLVPETLFIRGQRVCVWGMSSDFNRPPGSCPLEEYLPEHQRSAGINLVLLHYGVEGWAQPFAAEPCLSRANLDRLDADVICVGHLHTPNETGLPGGAVLLNPGATEHIHFGEENLHCGYWILRMEPGHVETEYVRLRTQPMRTLRLNLEERLGGQSEINDPKQTDLTPRPPSLRACERIREGGEVIHPDPEALMQSLLEAVAGASRPDGMLRIRLEGRVPRTLFQKLDLGKLQALGSEGSFHCQLDLEKLTIFDELADVQFGVGVSFDAGTEIQSAIEGLVAHYEDDPVEQELYRLAGQELAAAYDRITGAGR